tara:strand:- start:2179 stop:2355 length:177 start_codon:yes stop_codon:yes gene_type:complete
MNIQSVKKVNKIEEEVLDHYEVTDTNGIVYHVPNASDNTDYRNILQWVADGNTIQEAD